jgi:signal transduction histidine kinase
MPDRGTEYVRKRRRRTAFLGGLLLALPVLVLSVFGLLSLRQDRKIIETEVRERAQTFAAEATERCWKRLTMATDTDAQQFRVSTNGGLLVPHPIQTVPSPAPINLSAFNPKQTELWQRIEADQNASSGLTNTLDTLRAFLRTDPPAEAEARARFRLAMLLVPSDAQTAAVEFQTIVKRFPGISGETGIPLSDLAKIQWAGISMIANKGNLLEIRSTLDLMASNAVAKPTALTPWILNRVAGWEASLPTGTNLAAHWKAVWMIDERNRRAYEAARRSLSILERSEISKTEKPSETSWPELFWFHLEDGIDPSGAAPQNSDWLAVSVQKFEDGSRSYLYRNDQQWLALLHEFAEAEVSLPDYLGVHYQIAGKTFAGTRASLADPNHPASQKPGNLRAQIGLRRDILAAASHRSADGKDLVTVSVSLIDPAKLYARQRQRIYWFGALIGVSVLVALVGFVSTWSAFQRQQRLYEMQTNFISSVTHELRAPIGSVRLMAENLKRAKVRDPKEQQKVFDYIVQECVRLSSMIENVLNLARIEQGRKGYEFEETDVHRLVADTVQLMQPHAAASQVALESRLDQAKFSGAGEAAILDGRAIQQLLINLIDNAIKHSPANSTVLVGLDSIANGAVPPAGKEVGSASGSSSAHRLRLWVADHGPGIPLEEQEKIFDRFYRLGSELRRETSGVGIGLSIVKHIVDAHRGKVWVENEPGGGSRFIVELPLIQRRNSAQDTQHTKPQPR